MQLRKLVRDDDAVSPVIGVILMVAITVILAAVIASFVLGVGQSETNNAPEASFSFDYEPIDDNPNAVNYGAVTISHDSGDGVRLDYLFVRGAGFNGSGIEDSIPSASTELEKYVRNEGGPQIDHTEAGQWNGTASAEDDESRIVSGDVAVAYVQSDYEIDIVYQPEPTGESATLSSGEGPMA